MVFDWTAKENKKYIPITTFVIGCAVGGVLMMWYMQKKGTQKMAEGGSVGSGQQAAQTIIQVQPAQTSAVAPAPIAPATAVSAAPIPSPTGLPM